MTTGEVLVVDDEPTILHVCQRSLELSGYSVETAQDAGQALERCRQRPFDLVLTDIAMPGDMNGNALLEEIKRRWPSTDVILMTAYPALENALPALKQGAYDYLVKPFDQTMLTAAVERCLQKRRLSKELNAEKTMRRELDSAYKELQKVERMKESFLARVNHELNTPLAASLMALGLLEQEASSEKQSRLVASLRNGLLRLQKIVDDLLLFSQLREGETPVTFSDVKLPDLLAPLMEKFRPYAEARGVSLLMHPLPALPPLRANASLVETAFQHLILNGIHFCRPGGRLEIKAFLDNRERVRVNFTDTGIGIPTEKMDRIFDGFYQVAEYLTREVGGLGLGLALVRQILETHGGSIHVASQEGHGSTFSTFWPINRSIDKNGEGGPVHPSAKKP